MVLYGVDTVLHGVTGWYRVSHGGTDRCYTVLQRVAWCYTDLHSVTGFYTVLQGVTRCYMVSHGVT